MTRFRSIGTETKAGAEIQSIGMDSSRISETPPLLGCIADDFTGATDLSGTLVKNGVRTVQMMGVVIALKSRSIAREEAVAVSLDALAWLRSAGCRQFLFKYCSTFDSTEQGNIGPVAEALMDKLGTDFTGSSLRILRDTDYYADRNVTPFSKILFVTPRRSPES